LSGIIATKSAHPRDLRAKAAPALAAGAAAVLLSGLGLAACGEKKETIAAGASPRPLALVLNSAPNAEHAAIYSAIANGDFRTAGVQLAPQTPPDPSAPLELLAAGRADIAVAAEPEVLLARDRGLRLVSVGSLVGRPLSSIIALGDRHIRQAADLRGRTVGTAGIPYESAELHTILAHAGLPASSARETDVGPDLVAAMLSRRVDATLGGSWNYDAIQLLLRHKSPTVIPVDQAGVPSYGELVLVVREDEARNRGPLLRAFLRALTRGEREVRADPARAIQPLLAANRSLDPHLQVSSVRHTLAATAAPKGHSFGFQDPAAWEAFGRWMLGQGLLTRQPNAGQALTNEFLPGEGP
jgi:putative hydroxymethylpyrimidine transport system substrate-binding protein